MCIFKSATTEIFSKRFVTFPSSDERRRWFHKKNYINHTTHTNGFFFILPRLAKKGEWVWVSLSPRLFLPPPQTLHTTIFCKHRQTDRHTVDWHKIGREISNFCGHSFPDKTDDHQNTNKSIFLFKVRKSCFFYSGDSNARSLHFGTLRATEGKKEEGRGGKRRRRGLLREGFLRVRAPHFDGKREGGRGGAWTCWLLNSILARKEGRRGECTTTVQLRKLTTNNNFCQVDLNLAP